MKFFLSHSSQDHELVKHLVEKAGALGIELYLAEHDVRAGSYLAEKIIAEIKSSDALVVLLTSAGNDSKYVAHEIGVAKGANKLVVPIVEQGADVDLAILQGIEYLPLDPGDAAADLDRVLSYLERLRQDSRKSQAEQASRQQVIVALGLLALLLLLLNTSK